MELGLTEKVALVVPAGPQEPETHQNDANEDADECRAQRGLDGVA